MEGNRRKMRAAILAGPRTASIQDVALPIPGPRQVRVRLEGCGVCGSNLPPWDGRPWFKYPFEPGAPGHEGWGEIESVGPEVKNVRVGDRVALLSDHAFAEYDIAEADFVVTLPEQLAGKPFPAEAIGCAMNAFSRCNIQPGQSVAVIGIGFLGALLTSLASKAGARVIAISRRPFSLEIAKAAGAHETLEMKDHGKIISAVQRLTDGKGCERVIEAVGQQWPLDIAGEITRERGRLIIVGYHQDASRTVNMQLWNWRGLDVINAHERDPMAYVNGMKAAVRAVLAGDLDPAALYTHFYSIDRISEAFNTARERPQNFLKALIQL